MNITVEIIKVIGIFGSIFLTAYVNYRFGKLHKQINSRMDELLAMTRKDGAAENQKRTDAKPQNQK